MGSQEVYDRLRSEKANPQADVWYGGPDTIFARGAGEGLLAPYRPAWADAVAPASRGTGDLYFGLYRTPAMPVYNSKRRRRGRRAARVGRPARPEVEGQDPDPRSRSPPARCARSGATSSRSPCARPAPPTRGFAWLARLDAKTKEYVFNPILMYEKLVRREGLVTIWDLPDTLLERQRGSPLQYVFPKSGTPVIDDAVGPRRRVPPPGSREAVHRLSGREADAASRRREDLPPAGAHRPRGARPTGRATIDREMVPADMDWPLVEKDGAGWMATWDRTIRGKGASAAR